MKSYFGGTKRFSDLTLPLCRSNHAFILVIVIKIPTNTVSLLSTESRSFGGAGRHGAQGGGRPLQDLRLPDPQVLREGRGEVHAAAAPQQRQDHRVHAQVSHTPR